MTRRAFTGLAATLVLAGAGCDPGETGSDATAPDGTECQPECADRECGPDGCGGTCGTCGENETCNPLTRSCLPACVPDCSGKECGDDGCGGSCGACPSGTGCLSGACLSNPPDAIDPGDPGPLTDPDSPADSDGPEVGDTDPGADPGADIPPLDGDVGAESTTDETPEQQSPELIEDDGAGDGTAADTDKGADADTDTDPDANTPPEAFLPKVEGDTVTVSNGVVTLVYDLAHGTFNLGRVPGKDGIVNGHSEALLKVQGAGTTIASSDPGPRILFQFVNAPDELGDAVVLRFDAIPNNKVGGLATLIALHRESPAVTFRTLVAMPFTQEVEVEEIRPVVARVEDGATLHLGKGTRDAVLVDNGSEILLDFRADALVVGENPGSGNFGPGLASNWSAVLCTAAKSCAVAGFLTTDRAIGLVSTDQQAGRALVIDGDEGLTLFSLRTRFSPRAALEASRTQSSDVAYVDLATDPHEALLRYGRAIATAGRKPPPAVPPSSWNSWGGGSGSGGQGQDIDETFILMNLETAARDFLPWGMDYFLIDDGWQKNDGTWTTDEARFPDHGAQDGMAWIADQIRAQGFLPGVWTAPFRAGKDWPIVIQHPDWVLELDDMGQVALGMGSNYVMLDPSNEEVRSYLRDIYTRITKDWGFRFIKLDFSVYAMLGASYKVPGKSGLALYKEALRVIREAVGPDTFLLIVSGTGVNWGVADSQRLTLDNMPRWGTTVSLFDQGIKATVLSASHRYWMGNTVWSNHPDLLFFREEQGLTAGEARAFALWASMFSGIVKLGESFTFLEARAAELALIQRMLPPLSAFPEPLDLFTRQWPELWRVPMAALGGAYDVFGLFHWGTNRDVPAQEDLGEEPRTLRIPAPLAPSTGQALLDLVDGTLLTGPDHRAIRAGDVEVRMEPRTGRLFLARAAPPLGTVGPLFLGTDRHLMGGAGVLTEVADGASGTRITFTKAVPGRVTRLYFLVAGGAAIEVTTADATDVAQERAPYADADLVTVTLTTATPTATATARYLAR